MKKEGGREQAGEENNKRKKGKKKGRQNFSTKIHLLYLNLQRLFIYLFLKQSLDKLGE